MLPCKGMDLAPLLQAICAEARVLSEPGTELGAWSEAVLVERGAAVLLCLALRELIGIAVQQARVPGEAGHVGVHLWSTGAQAGSGSPHAYMLVACGGPRFKDELANSHANCLSTIQRYVEAAGGVLVEEPGPGGLWRISLI